ncbi:Asp-tRNA(Asn)/Glu-tRNA(Gln) amidotransferase subunit GatC [Spiroplasma endosymbiont of Crioceris asparagi]|uniref:Asp-tRNA(Asn)/Glu-tRNA(Gln) amidotransferase subunit GatC n=1 Tax=Spiroplasma endosymbiont of Crioceris asparagi TaxID=3066286 RepID=UPI0030CFA489
MTKEQIKELAEDLLIDLSEDEIKDILLTDENVEKRFEKIINYQVADVEPLDFPFEINNTFLREDDQIEAIEKETILNLAPEKNADYIIVKKVI